VIPRTGHDGEGRMTALERSFAITVLAVVWIVLPV
jgi:hypothetical protein